MTNALATTPPTPTELRRTGQVITLGTWALIGAVCTFSGMTGAQFIGAHSPWHWSGWVLAIGIDTAFIMALQADATLARYGTASGFWPTTFRWTTGTFSVFVNIGDAALHYDVVAIAVHLIAPALLLVLGEAGPAWRHQLLNLEHAVTMNPRALTDGKGMHTMGLNTASDQDERPTTVPAEQQRTHRILHAAEAHAAHSPVTTHGAHQVRTTSHPSALTGIDDAANENTGEDTEFDETSPNNTCDVTKPPADASEARSRIVNGLRRGLSQRETARRAHRSPTYVRKVWTALEADDQQPPRPASNPPVMDVG